MKKSIILLLMILLFCGCEKRLHIHSGKIDSIHSLTDLDQMAEFHFIIMSDNKGNSGEDCQPFARLEKRISETDPKFVIGLGDHVKKGYANTFLDLILQNAWWQENFYPNIADGENEYYGKSQADWGAGKKLLEELSMESNAKVHMQENHSEYYLKRKIHDFTLHLIQLHYPDQPAEDSLAFREESKQFLAETLLSIQKSHYDIVIAAAHSRNGFWFDKLSESQQKIVLEKCDLVLSATTHFFERQIIPEYENAGPLFINTGSISYPSKYSPFGFIDVHVLSYPHMLVVQYLDANKDTLEFQNSDYAFIKKINGEIIETDFREKRPEENMNRVVAFLPLEISKNRMDEIASDLYRTQTNADIAIVEVAQGLPAGEIQYAQLWDIFPYNNQICRIRMNQAVISKELNLSVDQIQSDSLWVAMSSFLATRLQQKLSLPTSSIEYEDIHEIPAFEDYLQAQFASNFPESTSTSIQRIAYATVYVDDFHENFQFYHQVLGLPKKYDQGKKSCFFELDDHQGLFLKEKSTSNKKGQPISRTTFAFSVASTERFFTELASKQVDLLQKAPQDRGNGIFWFQFLDPSGNIIEVTGGK